jgi:hypothetical protein
MDLSLMLKPGNKSSRCDFIVETSEQAVAVS